MNYAKATLKVLVDKLVELGAFQRDVDMFHIDGYNYTFAGPDDPTVYVEVDHLPGVMTAGQGFVGIIQRHTLRCSTTLTPEDVAMVRGHFDRIIRHYDKRKAVEHVFTRLK